MGVQTLHVSNEEVLVLNTAQHWVDKYRKNSIFQTNFQSHGHLESVYLRTPGVPAEKVDVQKMPNNYRRKIHIYSNFPECLV